MVLVFDSIIRKGLINNQNMDAVVSAIIRSLFSTPLQCLFRIDNHHSEPLSLYRVGLFLRTHYIDVIMTTMAFQITSLTVVYSTVYSDADQRKHQSSDSLAYVWGIHRRPVNSPYKWPVTRKMFPFDDVIMIYDICTIVAVK